MWYHIMVNMFISTLQYLSKNKQVAVIGLTFIYCFALYLYPYSFKLGIMLSFAYIVLYYVISRNFYLSLLSTFIVSAFFPLPAKNYPFIYAHSSEYNYELFKNGGFRSITLAIADVFGFFLILFFIRERIRNRAFINVLNYPMVMFILIAWFVYFAFSLFSSLSYSVFPTYSINVLAQGGKMVLVFVGIVYLFTEYKQKARYIYWALLASLLSISVIGLSQFGNNLSPAGISDNMIPLDIEERTNFFRISGISGHPNYHAFLTGMLILFVLPFVLKRRNIFFWIIVLLGLLNLFFAQSRSVWLVMFVQSLFGFFVYFRNIKNIFNMKIHYAMYKLLALIVITIFGLLVLFVLPRLSKSSIFFSKQGGAGLRVRMITEGWQLLQQAPWTGFGISMDVRVFLNKMPNGYTTIFPFPVHFAYLQIALESGIPATIMFFLPFYLMFRAWFGVDGWKKLHTPTGLIIFWGYILIFGYYSAQIINARKEYILLGIFLGLGVAYKYLSNNQYEL